MLHSGPHLAYVTPQSPSAWLPLCVWQKNLVLSLYQEVLSLPLSPSRSFLINLKAILLTANQEPSRRGLQILAAQISLLIGSDSQFPSLIASLRCCTSYCICISYIKKKEKSQIHNLNFYLENWKKDQTKPKASKRREIIKIREEIREQK